MKHLKKTNLVGLLLVSIGFCESAFGQPPPASRGFLGRIRNGQNASTAQPQSQPQAGTQPNTAKAAKSVDQAVRPASANSSPVKTTANSEKKDTAVRKANNVLPGLTPVEELAKPTIALPTEPIEPYLLTKECGPFMVIAHTFRGPEATRFAQALAMELRAAHQLRAYIYFNKIKPMRSNVRGVPPTSAPEDGDGRISEPEIYRIYDEAVVLVGDAPTLKEAEELLKVVKKIKPATLESVPSIFPWRTGTGLKKAIVTANPLIPAQQLFARETDPLIDRMNRGPHSLYNCPGPYTLVVARYAGRTTIGNDDQDTAKDNKLKTSPLATATDEAELLATELNKDPQLQKAGYQAYVYHDRKDSVVTLGNFQEKVPQANMVKDQKVQSIRQHLDKLNQKYLSSGKFNFPMAPVDFMDVPKRTVQQKASGGFFQ